MSNNLLKAMGLTDKDVVSAILGDFYILDYGYVNKVNDDGTVNVTHAILPKLEDGSDLDETTTDNLEVLTFSFSGLSISYTLKQGDKVLLLGLKEYIKSVATVTKAQSQTAPIHYNRATLKVVPIGEFNEDAGSKIIVTDGKTTIYAKESVCLNGSDNGGLIVRNKLVTQLDYLTARVDTIIDALSQSATGSQDGGATYKANIVAKLNTITNKEDFSDIENNTVLHGSGE